MFFAFAFLFAASSQEAIAIGGFQYHGRDGDRANKFSVAPGGASQDYEMSIVITNTGHTDITLTHLEVKNDGQTWTSGTENYWKVAIFLNDDETLLNPKGDDLGVTIPASRIFVTFRLYCEGSGDYFLSDSFVKITIHSAAGNIYQVNFFID
jgi:hypothetical protein